MRQRTVRSSYAHPPQHISRAINSAVKETGTPGVLQTFMLESLATPYGAKANCYAHFLGLQSGLDKKGMIVRGALTDRNSKSQPGEVCSKATSKTPLRFDNREMASVQLIDRVLCDNPGITFYLKPPYAKANMLIVLLTKGPTCCCAT